ncbi:Factor arrest protein 11 [Malassezia pachydermatis]
MPIYLFELVANLREKSIKGFPVKKLVLLLWKALLAVLGGTEDIARCKALVRRREGLAPRSALSRQSVVTPNDVLQFRQEWMAKYPALIDAEDQQELVPGERLASTTQPLPVNGKDASSSHLLPSMLDEERLAAAKAAAAPPLKVGRQKFQTDQSRPYVLPFASGVSRGSAMPLSMQEAISLYQSHMYVDTGLWQMWCVRQELMDDLYGTHDPTAPTLQSELAAMTLSDSTERTPAPQREDMEDEQRLKRIELLYRSTLPSLQSAVIVLLKLMLATTTSSGTSSAFMRATADGALPEQAPSPTLEDVDVVRHREIMNKGISAVLLLCLRWFRVNHMLQFEYLSQILLDSNVLLLILKLFGLHEVGHSIRSRCEAYPFGLFEYCRLVGHSGSQETPQSVLDRTHLRIGDVWPEYPDDPARLRHVPANAPLSQAFSWRNMASAWCLTRILYLVCRHKVHRILLLVQYKSSAILKRTLKVPQPDLELYVLKLLKIQIPYCGRKWRQSNMRIITQIYLRCRPSLRDDWPGGGDVESEVETSLADEQTLRTLIQYYNQTRYHFQPPVLQQQTLSAADDTDGAKHGSGAHAPHQPTAPSHAEADRDAFEREAFPARRTSSVASTPGRYIASVPTDGYLDAYEDMLQELFANVPLESLTAPTPTHPDATSMLPTSSSTAASTSSSSTTDAGQNDWEHLSPREMTYLSRSPRLAPSVPSPTRSPSPAPSARRRSSTVAAPPTSETSASTKTRRHMRNVSFSLLSTSSPALAYHRRVNSSPGMQRPPLHWSMKDLVEDAISSEQGDNVPAPEPDILIPDVPLPSPKPGGIDEVEHIFGA